MKKYIYVVIFIFIFDSFLYAKAVNYDPKILNIPYNSWTSPFSYYKTALVIKQVENFVQLDKGEFHGMKTGFIYSIRNSSNNAVAKIVISGVYDNFSEGYFISSAKEVIKGDLAVFTNTIDLEENKQYSMCLDPEVKVTITLVENDVCYAPGLTEKSNVFRGQPFDIFDLMDSNAEDIGQVEVIDVIPDGTSAFKIIRKGKPIKPGFILISKPRNLSTWKNLGVELSKKSEDLQVALYSFYRTYELDKKNTAIIQEFINQSKRLAGFYEKNKQNYKAAQVYKQCQTITYGCRDELQNSLEIIKNESIVNLGNKNLLPTIKDLELLERDADIQTKLSASYNNEAASFGFDENPEYQIYLYGKAFEIDNKNILAAKNLFNLYLYFKNYDSALNHLKTMEAVINIKDEKEWILKKIDEITRIQKGLIRNCTFKTTNQRTIELISLRGNIVLMIQWSMRDEKSKQLIDFLPSFNDKFKKQSFKLLAINVDPRGKSFFDDIKIFLKKYEDFDLEIVYSEEDMKDVFKLGTIPEIILLDKEGKIVYQESGTINDDLEQIINRMIKE